MQLFVGIAPLPKDFDAKDLKRERLSRYEF